MPRRRDKNTDAAPPRGGGVWVTVGVVGGVGVLLLVALLVGMLLTVGKTKDQAGRREVGNHIHQIAIGIHNYHDQNGRIGSPFAADRQFGGRPSSLTPTQRLSWRAEMLPYLEQGPLYSQFNPSEAWDSPTNISPASAVIRTFHDPNDPMDNQTRFRCFYDNGAIWDSKPNSGVSLVGITDGTSNTILFVDAADRGPWAQFNELKFDPNGPPPQLGHPQRSAFVAGMADGSVRWVKKTVSPAALNAAITRAGNETPGPEFEGK